MTAPAPFLVDPLDHTQLLIGTCRVWRGPAERAAGAAATPSAPCSTAGPAAAPAKAMRSFAPWPP